MKNFSDYLNEEIRIRGNKGIPPEKLRDIEGKGREKIAGMRPDQVGGHLMELVRQSQQYTRGHEEELQQLAKDVIQDAFQGVLNDMVNLDIQLVQNGNQVDRFMKNEDAEKEEERKDEDQDDQDEDQDNQDDDQDDQDQDEDNKPKEKTKLTKDQIEAAVHKRKIINNIIQGEAKNTKNILHSDFCKEGLKEIFGERRWREIFDIWDEITKLADKMDWLIPVEHKAQMMEQQPGGMAGACSVRWPKKKKDEKPKDDKKDEKPKDKKVEKGKDEPKEEEIKPTVKSRGVDFPMLLHETVKGIYEALSDPGMPRDAELASIVHQQTSSFADEAEDFKYGPYLAADLRDFINKNPKIGTYPNLREFVYGKLIDSDRWTDEECLENLKNVFLESPAGRKLVDDLLEESIQELKDWEEGQKENIDDYIKKATAAPAGEEDGETIAADETESDIDKIIKQSEENKEKDYSKMSQSELQELADNALGEKDFETLKKISKYLKEGKEIFLKEIERINESYKFHTRRKK